MTRPSQPSRRSVLRGATGAGALAVTGLSVSSCGSAPSAGRSGAGAAPAGTALAKSSDVPVGGGVILPADQVVVTQPSSGVFKAFSTTCPHQGCAVTSVTAGFIVCPCHNSRFAVATGEPTPDSPARSGLAARPVTLTGGEVTLA